MPAPLPANPRRIAVIGTSGSGKSTLARQIAAAIDAPHIELDALFHGPNWTPADPEVFRARVSQAVAAPEWVSDGNYSRFLGDIVWSAADLVVWLDYPFPTVFTRLFRRTMSRAFRREELWNGNRESLRTHFFTRESLFLWAAQTHWKHRRDWAAAFASPERAHTPLLRLRRPSQTTAWLKSLGRAGSADKPAGAP